MRRRLSLLALIATNGAVFVAALLGKIAVTEVLMLYWAESAVIGFFTVLKMLFASPEDEGVVAQLPGRRAGLFVRVFLSVFFCVHFGGFMFVHLLFLGVVVGTRANGVAFEDAGEVLLYFESLLLVLGGLVLSHGISFVLHYWIGGERKRLPAAAWFFRPYVRIFVMQATLIAGGILFFAAGSSFAILALLIVLKTAVDAYAHLREHDVPVALAEADARRGA